MKGRRFISLPGARPAPPAAAGEPEPFPAPAVGRDREPGLTPRAELHLEMQFANSKPPLQLLLVLPLLHRASLQLDRLPLPPGLSAHNKDLTVLLSLSHSQVEYFSFIQRKQNFPDSVLLYPPSLLHLADLSLATSFQ